MSHYEVKFPSNFTPLPPGYKVIALDYGSHYQWVLNDEASGSSACPVCGK